MSLIKGLITSLSYYESYKAHCEFYKVSNEEYWVLQSVLIESYESDKESYESPKLSYKESCVSYKESDESYKESYNLC